MLSELASPLRETRSVQAFATQQCADLPGLGAELGFLDDAALVRRREAPTLGAFHNFRIGQRRGRDDFRDDSIQR